MPLGFDSLSHGTIAFGFFNIESDMLLCDRYFLYADRFCRYVEAIAEHGTDCTYHARWQVQFIESTEGIGDLPGAIQGVRHTGFIGELYRFFPFPDRAQDFKQNPKGSKTQARVSEIIANYAESQEIPVVLTPGRGEIQIGVYRFSSLQFQELIKYVWRGGYPGWKDEIRPGYVTDMRAKILRHCNGILDGINNQRPNPDEP